MSDPAHDGPPAASPPAPDHDIERSGAGSTRHLPSAEMDGLLAVVKNLSQYHREHEKYYSEAPLADAIALQRAARTLIALAERWTSVQPAAEPVPSPFAGSDDQHREPRWAVTYVPHVAPRHSDGGRRAASAGWSRYDEHPGARVSMVEALTPIFFGRAPPSTRRFLSVRTVLGSSPAPPTCRAGRSAQPPL